MAAASNKPTLVHYSLIAFVVFTIILGATTYNFQSEYTKARKDEEKAKADNQIAQTTIRSQDDSIAQLKKLLGTPQEQVFDQANPDSATTVSGEVKRQNAEQGLDLADSTLLTTLAKLRQALNTTQDELKSKSDTLVSTQQQMLALEQRYKDIADSHQKARTAAEADKRTVINERDEKIAQKDQEISNLRAQYNQSQVELEQEKEARSKERKQLQDENLRLTLINDKLREELDDIKKESFEVGDGIIARVENAAKLVWINIGDADFLKPRMTFSVYSKDTPGVGRTTADVKGKVEVTRVLDAHLSEAKMIEEDPFRPMAPGDIIYTPLWSPGRSEKFAVVGKIDLDNDGQSDRELFHQEMAVRGAELAVEVDDNGNRMPEGGTIDESIKFLILGSIADIGTVVNEDDRAKAKLISQQYKDLRQEARLHGVRIITLSDFLAYVGYKSKRRLFRPGESTKFNLKAGAASVGINQPLGDIQSGGQVSGSFSKTKTTQPKSSSGQTSKLYGK